MNTKLTKGNHTQGKIASRIAYFQLPIHFCNHGIKGELYQFLGYFLGHVYEYDLIPQFGNPAVSTISHGQVYFYFYTSMGVFHDVRTPC